jgi:hypothetical protein
MDSLRKQVEELRKVGSIWRDRATDRWSTTSQARMDRLRAQWIAGMAKLWSSGQKDLMDLLGREHDLALRLAWIRRELDEQDHELARKLHQTRTAIAEQLRAIESENSSDVSKMKGV